MRFQYIEKRMQTALEKTVIFGSHGVTRSLYRINTIYGMHCCIGYSVYNGLGCGLVFLQFAGSNPVVRASCVLTWTGGLTAPPFNFDQTRINEWVW